MLVNLYTQPIYSNRKLNHSPAFTSSGRDFDFDVNSHENRDNFYIGGEEEPSLADRWYYNHGIITSNPNTAVKPLPESDLANLRKLPNDSFSGERLTFKPKYFESLRSNGITRVIDIAGEDMRDNMDKKCKENGLDYYSFTSPWKLENMDIFQKDQDIIEKEKEALSEADLSPEELERALNNTKSLIAKRRTSDVQEFANYINVVNQGHYYMCCEFGEYRTKNALAIASIFNPKWPKDKKIDPTYEFAKNIVNMYRNLTDEHKQILNIDDDYDKWLSEYIDDLESKTGK